MQVDRVVKQLSAKPQYLYMYLDGLFDADPAACQPYSDDMVSLYAEYDHSRLMPFLRASNFYDLERALRICESHDYVHETVFLLGRMGNNLKALHLIIERLGDVRLAIDFAEEQRDDDLWEALLAHSETRPEFIRALLEHGGEINPVRLIQRIKEGLEIPGLKPALVKVLQASNLSVTLLEGCQRILNGDCSGLAITLQRGQVTGAHATRKSSLPHIPATSGSASELTRSHLDVRRVREAAVRHQDVGPRVPRPRLSLPAPRARDVRAAERRHGAARAARECGRAPPPARRQCA